MIDYKYLEGYKFKYLEPIHSNKLDFYLCNCGIEKCNQSHSFGPAVRDHFIIHYIIDGEGTYTVNNKTYKLKKNDGFLIYPDTITYYEADKENPWTYAWIGFNGIKSKLYLSYSNLDINNLIFNYSKDDSLKSYILEILNLNRMDKSNELKIEGLLYFFFSKLAEESKGNGSINSQITSDIYINKSIEFISSNYTRNIRVSDISNYVGLNRSYLSSLFKKQLNTSPQAFLLNYRIERACHLLSNVNLSIGDVARSVGYVDQLNFSKIFKKIKGVSPKIYRETKIK